MSDQGNGSRRELLDSEFPAFVARYFPRAHRDVDWARGYETLDPSPPSSPNGHRAAERLAKVWRHGGDPGLLLIRLGECQPLFLIDYRLFERCPATILTVGSEEGPGWRPRPFLEQRWGCRLWIHFPAVQRHRSHEASEDLEERQGLVTGIRPGRQSFDSNLFAPDNPLG